MPSEFHNMELGFNPDGMSKALTHNCTRVVLKDIKIPLKDCSKVVSELLNTYAWERKCQIGQLLAIHRNGILCAYTFRTKVSSFVRVINVKEKTRSNPAPIKNQVVHIAWAFSLFPPTVGIIDIYAEMFFFQVAWNDKLSPVLTPWLTVNRELSVMCGYPLFSWCPYAKGDQEDSPISQMGFSEEELSNNAAGNYASMIVATVGQQAQVMILSQIVKEKGSTVAYSKERCAACVITEESVVTYACLSPDGTALCLSTEAGLVKLYILESFADVRRAHQWYPHGQKPVTTIVFLDSLCSVQNYSAEVQFWKTAITSAEGNRELYLWECDSWQRTSAVEIPAASETASNLSLFISRDAHFAIVSDVECQLLYIFEIVVKGSKPHFSHFAYVCLFQPIISLDIKELHITETDNSESPDERNREAITGLLIAINPKSLLSLTLNIEKALPEEDVANGSNQCNTSNISAESIADKKNCENPIVASKEKDDEVLLGQYVPNKPEDEVKEPLVNAAQPESFAPDSETSLSAEEINQIPMELRKLFMESMNDNYDLETKEAEDSLLKDRNSGTMMVEATCDTTESFAPSCELDLLSSMSVERDLSEVPLVPQANYALSDQGGKELASLKAVVLEQGRVLTMVMRQLHRLEESEIKAVKLLDELNDTLKATRSRGIQGEMDEHKAKAMATAIMSEMSLPDNALVKNLKREIQCGLFQGISKILINNRQQIDRNLQKTFQCLKGQIQEGFGTIHEKRLAEAIGSKISAAIAEDMNKCFRNTFTSVLVPAFDNCVQKLFDNVNAVFQEGTQEYFEQLTAAQDNVSEAGSQRMLEIFTERLAGIGKEIKALLQSQLLSLMGVLKEGIATRDLTELEAVKTSVSTALTKVVKDQIAVCMEENKSGLLEAVRHAALSGALPESSCKDPRVLREMISKLAENEMYSEAFAQAINTGDPTLVTFVCSLVDVRKVFDSNHALLSVSQSLQLVHLLVSSLSEDEIELKLEYILAALAALDESATDMKLDLAILEANYVVNMLSQYSEHNPKSPFASEIRVINLVAKAIAKKKSP